ncbi:hypothetical protein [Saccharomonospora saliphila]|uniref:hypothetical protein n=1 Tax=Saccharomonospora saliphila TaxID=369829 RepID=UPI0012FAB6C6|nr:hypothetical protein [Saccharomonospora saliphila]
MPAPRSESDVLRTMAAALGEADRPELREIGRAVRDGSLTFADAAASSGYREVFADCARQLAEMSEDEFFGGDDLIPGEEPGTGGNPDPAAEEEPDQPESYLIPATPRRRDRS